MTDAEPKRWPYRGRQISAREAAEEQRALAAQVVERWAGREPRTVAGIDIGLGGGRARAAVALLSFPELAPIEVARAERSLDFPYIPGLLAFREVPAILDAFAKLRERPDLLLVDGQGRAHPRRCGVACHLGVEFDLPAIGIGKSRLVGEHREPGPRRGAAVQLRDGAETIGKVVRTREGVRPIFVSVGHWIDLATAVRLALRCTRGYRLPEPIRAAHHAAGPGWR